MPALIVLVNANRRTLRHTEALLSEAGHLVAPVSSYADAKKLLDSVTPDLLVADIRLAEFNGLQLAIRSHLDHPSLPVIVTYSRPDPIFEAEAKEYGAAFVAAPLAHPSEFLGLVQSALEDRRRGQSPIRRWSRKYVSGLLEVNAAEVMARIVDVSYGGVRLAFSDNRDIPTRFEITLPPSGTRLMAHRVWTAHTSDDQYWCGAEFDEDARSNWREFVNSVSAQVGL